MWRKDKGEAHHQHPSQLAPGSVELILCFTYSVLHYINCEMSRDASQYKLKKHKAVHGETNSLINLEH